MKVARFSKQCVNFPSYFEGKAPSNHTKQICQLHHWYKRYFCKKNTADSVHRRIQRNLQQRAQYLHFVQEDSNSGTAKQLVRRISQIHLQQPVPPTNEHVGDHALTSRVQGGKMPMI